MLIYQIFDKQRLKNDAGFFFKSSIVVTIKAVSRYIHEKMEKIRSLFLCNIPLLAALRAARFASVSRSPIAPV